MIEYILCYATSFLLGGVTASLMILFAITKSEKEAV